MTAAKTSRPATGKGRKADRRAEQAELGEVRFEDWFETPIFDTEPDERLEELTTTGARPMRLAARALVRLDASKGRKRSRGRAGGRKADPFADLAATASEEEFAPADLWDAPADLPEAAGPETGTGSNTAVESRPVTARRRRPLKAAAIPAEPAPGPTAAAAPARPAPAPTAAPAPAGPAPAPTVARPARPLRAERAPRPVTAAAPTPAPAPAPLPAGTLPAETLPVGTLPVGTLPVGTPSAADPASGPATAAGAGWRARAGRALDAWAARELEAQARLEQVIVPKRWRS